MQPLILIRNCIALAAVVLPAGLLFGMSVSLIIIPAGIFGLYQSRLSEAGRLHNQMAVPAIIDGMLLPPVLLFLSLIWNLILG